MSSLLILINKMDNWKHKDNDPKLITVEIAY